MATAKVLIVEDERVVALHLRQQLSRLGYQVPAMATAGEQALQHIRDFQPDVVLMDIHIEGDIDGIETAARIPPELHVPVIYLTAYSEEATLERARLTKPYGYLLKPFSERELHAAIQMVLERRLADSALEKDTQRLEALVSVRTEALVQANRKLESETAERLTAERALHQAQKMDAVGQLTGGVAHDFNNLMQIVIGNLSVVVHVLPDEQAVARELSQKAMSAARSAAVLTERLLAFARRQPLAPKPIDINALLNGMSDLLRRALGETVIVETAACRDHWLTEADPNQLESMISEFGDQRSRCHAGRREAEDRDGERRGGPLARRRRCRAEAGQVRRSQRVGYGTWDGPDHARPGFRAVLYYEGRRQRHGPWAVAGLWLRQTIRRTCAVVLRAR